jgi:2,3-dihydroxyphenylpropionate 1,2-dioxygenase
MPLANAAANHAPGITIRRDRAPEAEPERFFAAYDELKRRLEAARLETSAVIAAEHFTNFFMNNMPAFCIGLAARNKGLAESTSLLRITLIEVPGIQRLARIIAALMMQQVEISYSKELIFDHGVMVPLILLTPEMSMAVVPLFSDCLTEPRAPAQRCYELGRVLRRAVVDKPERIGVLGTGGLPHSPAVLASGKLNATWDEEFLDAFPKNDRDRLFAYCDHAIGEAGGPGGHEIRTWIAVAGAIEGCESEKLIYLPIPRPRRSAAAPRSGVSRPLPLDGGKASGACSSRNANIFLGESARHERCGKSGANPGRRRGRGLLH